MGMHREVVLCTIPEINLNLVAYLGTEDRPKVAHPRGPLDVGFEGHVRVLAVEGLKVLGADRVVSWCTRSGYVIMSGLYRITLPTNRANIPTLGGPARGFWIIERLVPVEIVARWRVIPLNLFSSDVIPSHDTSSIRWRYVYLLQSVWNENGEEK